MQKGRVLRLQCGGVFDFFRKNLFLLSVIIIFTIGFLVGIFGFDSIKSLKNFSDDYISDYISLRTGYGFGGIFVNSLMEFLSLMFVMFLLGTSLFGVITVPCAILIKGILSGGITSYLYSFHGLKGIAFNAVILIPPTIIFLIILLVSSRESVRFSIKLSSLTLSRTLPFNLSSDFKDYTVKYLILSASTLVCAFIDAIISSGLIEHFTL